MALTIFTGTAGQTSETITWDYIDASHVVFYVEDVEVPFSFVSPTQLILDTPLVGGEYCAIKRETPTFPLVDFNTGSNVTETELDLIAKQGVYLAAEAKAQVAVTIQPRGVDGYDMNGKRLSNVGDAVSGSDAVNLTGMTAAMAEAKSDLENDFASVLADAEQAADDAEDQADIAMAAVAELDTITAEATSLVSSEVATAVFDPATFRLSFGIPRGEGADVGATFNVLRYIALEVGGPAQVALVVSGDWDLQDGAIVTAGVQEAAVAYYESGRTGQVTIPAGAYRMIGEVMGGICSNGKSVAENIWTDGLSKVNGIERSLFINADRSALLVGVEGEFASQDQLNGVFPDAVMIRYQDRTRRAGSFSGNFPRMYWEGDYASRWNCPTAIVIKGANLGVFDFNGASPRGSDYVWHGNGIVLESNNNCQYFNIRSKAGATPLAVEGYDAGNADFDLVLTGVDDRMKLMDASLDRLAPPAGKFSSYYNGMYALISLGTLDCDRTLVRFDGTITEPTGETSLSIAEGWEPATTGTGLNVGFQLPHASITSGSNTVTFQNPVLEANMVGRMIFVEGLRDNHSDMGVMVAYIRAVVDEYTCTLEGIDGVDANFGETATKRAVWFSSNFSAVLIYAASYPSKNDDLYFYGLSAESGGGCQIFFQGTSGVRVFGSKGHGRADIGNSTYRQDFTRTGLCYAFDNCLDIVINGTQIDWAAYIDVSEGTTSTVKVYGDDNNIELNGWYMYGSNDKMTLIDMKEAGVNSRVAMSGGSNRFNGWRSAGTEHVVVAYTAVRTSLAACFWAGAPISNKNTGERYSSGDMLEPFRHIMTEETVVLELGSDTVTVADGRKMIRIQHTEATADVTTINGLPDGFVGLLSLNNSNQNVVLKDGMGNIQSPDGMGDITLNKTRDVVNFYVVGGQIRIISTAL